MSSPRKRGSIGHRGHSQVSNSRVAALHSAGGVTRSGSCNHKGEEDAVLFPLQPPSPAASVAGGGLTGEFANPAIKYEEEGLRGLPPRAPSSRSLRRRDGLTGEFAEPASPDSAHRPYKVCQNEGDPDSSAIVNRLFYAFVLTI